MHERMFGSGDGGDDGSGSPDDEHGPLDDERATIAAAELAELALDEIARAGHDWNLIGDLARRLAAVAARASDRG